jgi:hypothetical protein
MSAYWGKYAGKLVIINLMFSRFFFFNQETIKNLNQQAGCGRRFQASALTVYSKVLGEGGRVFHHFLQYDVKKGLIFLSF